MRGGGEGVGVRVRARVGRGECWGSDACKHYKKLSSGGTAKLCLSDCKLCWVQGNGTAALFEDDPRVTTFDIHGAGNYPWRSRMTNTYDVALPDGTRDAEYLTLLRTWLPRLMVDHQPQLILFQAGVDALEGDSFGRLALSRQGLLERNHLVYSLALDNKVPLCITMGGGYTKPPDASIACHADVYRSAAYRLHAWAVAEVARAEVGQGR